MVEVYENELPTLIKDGGDKWGKWLFVEDAAEMMEVSKRTIFEYLRDNKISGIKSRGRRLVSTGSVLGYLLKQKVIEIKDLRDKELARETLYNVRTRK
jgi:excisionase family DNA binding protein